MTEVADAASGRASGRDDAPELRALAEGIVALARPGEQVEVFVTRGASTTVKAYHGEVESLTSAESAGVGIRVIQDHRQGFAHAGTLDPDVIREVLDDARDNATFGEQDEFFALTSSDGVAVVDQDLWNDDLVAFAPERKVDLALTLERAVLGRDPRVTGVRTAAFGDSRGEAAIASTAGIAASWRGTYCSISVSAVAVDGDET
jgi:PmbA protein